MKAAKAVRLTIDTPLKIKLDAAHRMMRSARDLCADAMAVLGECEESDQIKEIRDDVENMADWLGIE